MNKADPSGRATVTIAQVAIAAVLVGTVAGGLTYHATGSIGAAVLVGASVAALTFAGLYVHGGLAVGGGNVAFVIREAIQAAVLRGR